MIWMTPGSVVIILMKLPEMPYQYIWDLAFSSKNFIMFDVRSSLYTNQSLHMTTNHNMMFCKRKWI